MAVRPPAPNPAPNRNHTPVVHPQAVGVAVDGRAPFAYYGGKARLAHRIVSLFPPHSEYIEPFFGSGAVLFAKRPATHEIVNDLDGAVVNFFRVLRERTDDLIKVCALTPHARGEFDGANLDDEDIDELELARRFWVRVNQSFSKTAGRQTGWSVTTSRTQSVPASVFGRLGRFEDCARRLATVTIECCDAADLVDRLATSATVIYADPPYVATSRMARKDRGGRTADYRCDMGGEDAHRRLAEALHATDATVFLSGYHSALYDELYATWDRVEHQVTAYASNSVTSGRTVRTEVIWSNRTIIKPNVLDLGSA